MPALTTHLFSIGIDSYDHFRRLRCCVSDAKEIVRIFRQKAPSIVVEECYGNAVNSITAPQVNELLQKIRSLSLDRDDHIFFYFAGHGFSQDGADYLVCSDTSEDEIGSAIPTQDVLTALTATGAGTAVLILDACRNILARDTGSFIKQTLELSRREGVIVFSACSPGEVSQELPDELNHGVFTFALCKTIVDDNASTPIEIDRQVINWVEEFCRDYKLQRQTPYTSVSPLQKAAVDIFTGQLKHSVEKPRKCILILGPSNAGKTRLGESIKKSYGFLHVEMSSFAWRRFREREPSYDGSLQSYLEEVVWPQEGNDILARDLLSSDNNIDQLVVSGARRIEEVHTLQAQQWDILTIFVYADSKLRFQRYIDSGEASLSASYKDFVLKDLREYSWGLAHAANIPSVNFIFNEHDWERFQGEVYKFIEVFIGSSILK